MSALPKSAWFITPEEYLHGEPMAKVRHEYVAGYVYAMAGASDDHNFIAGNIFTELNNQLRGRACVPFIVDMKVKVSAAFSEAFYYPDVMVACDPTDKHKYYRERPAIIIEVLSPDTERTDRQEKAIAYRQIPGIKNYVLVRQDRMEITVLHAAENQEWRSENVEGPSAVLKLEAINVEIPLARIYERTSVAEKS